MKKMFAVLFFVAVIAVLAAIVFLLPRFLNKKTNLPVRASVSLDQEIQKADLSTLTPPKTPAPPSQSVDQEKAIRDIRRELQSVMDLNSQINAVKQTGSSQMLRIQEQVQIQQKMLVDIQRISTSANAKIPSREALLAQEKLRMIHEQTLRNTKILEETVRKTAS